MFCGECGTQNPDTNQFCKNCGRPLKKGQPAVATGQVPVMPAPYPGILPATTSVQPTTGKRTRNWIGRLSVVCSILSWIILTVILAVVAIILGLFSLYITRKETGKIAYSAIAGIIIAVAAVLVSMGIS
jgi:hypothetical protein